MMAKAELKIPVREGPEHPLVPKKAHPYIARLVLEEKYDLDLMNYAWLRGRKPTLLIGPTGVGKTSLPRRIAYSTKRPYMRVNFAEGIEQENLLGHIEINENGETVWVDGVLTKAVRDGYIFVADEVNAMDPDIAFNLHPLLDDDRFLLLTMKDPEGDDTSIRVEAHPDFWFVGTMNRGIEYTGTKELNAAFMRRFPVKIIMTYPKPEVERKIIMLRVEGINDIVVTNIVEVANKARLKFNEKHIPISTGDLIEVAEMSMNGFTVLEAFETVIVPIFENKNDVVAFRTTAQKYIGKNDVGTLRPNDKRPDVPSPPAVNTFDPDKAYEAESVVKRVYDQRER